MECVLMAQQLALEMKCHKISVLTMTETHETVEKWVWMKVRDTEWCFSRGRTVALGKELNLPLHHRQTLP